MQFFSSDDTTETQMSQSIIDFMNDNTRENDDSLEYNVDPYKEIHKPFKNKSSWKPPPNKTLDTYKRAFKMDLLKCEVDQSHQCNLTKEQWKGLMELGKNPEIVIKKADKGSAVVIMNTSDYLCEGYRQLGDPNFYISTLETLKQADFTFYPKYINRYQVDQSVAQLDTRLVTSVSL